MQHYPELVIRRIRVLTYRRIQNKQEEGSMRRNPTRRLMAFVLSLLMLVGCFVPAFAADETGASSLGTTTLKDISESLNAISYAAYREKYPDAVRGVDVAVDIAAYIADATTANVELRESVADAFGDTRSNCLYVGDSGKVSWPVSIPKTGLYAMEIEYCSASTKTNSIERMLYINDKVPFKEARYLNLTKTWEHDYDEETGRFKLDNTGSELRPVTSVVQKWSKYSIADAGTYYANPFEFYFEKGENTISLEGVREDIIISAIRLYPYEDLPTYAEKLEEYAKRGYAEGTDVIHLDGEKPAYVSDYTIYPIYDRTSAITEPQHATKIMRNTIGSEKWQTTGQWIEYNFHVENAGLYTINLRFKQSELSGLYVSRRLTIDGKVPFEECNFLRFDYNTDWQVGPLNDGGEYGGFQLYLEPGDHTLRLEVTLGDMGDIVRRVSESLSNINDSYLQIMKLTGVTPDRYRDYGFTRVMPDTIETMILESMNLYEVIDYMSSMNGGKSQHTGTLEQVAVRLHKMGTDEDQIARNLGSLKDNISTMGTWITNVSNQSLEVDYIQIQGASAEMPKAKANFFESTWHELKMFFGSFFADYNTLGGERGGDAVTAWMVTGRDQATIMRNLVDDKFTPETGVAVDLKLVAGGTLLPSVLAGVGPDVALDGADPIQYAIRGAVLPLNDFDTFDEVCDRFTEAAIIPLTLYGKTYGLPETQTFWMMFYRKDILADLGLEVPKTWDDLMAMVPVLQFNNMQIGLPNTLQTNYQVFMYQNGGKLWVDDGMRVNLDSNVVLESFEDMCNMFTQYSLPYKYDFANRFKSGEMPIGIITYTEYNKLILFSTEISGLWEMVPLPGMTDENGNINNTSPSSVASIVMMKGCKNEENAWKFMDWWVDRDFQVDYSNELVAVMGPAAKNATANREALEELPWSSSEYQNLTLQMNNLMAEAAYPGSYIIGRYAEFAFLDSYNKKLDPVDSLLNYINTINKEINRKRTEFDYETLEIGQTLADKRTAQAIELMTELTGYDAEIAAATAALENEDVDAMRQVASKFARSASDETLGQIAIYLTEAADALATYKLYE